MKLKTLMKKLSKLNPEAQVEYLTAPGQWGRVSGAHQETEKGRDVVYVDVVEDDESWESSPF